MVVIPIKTGALRVHLRVLALAAYTQTWVSNGGVEYRKRPLERQIDAVRFAEACKIAADYLALDGCRTEHALRAAITDALIAEGELVYDRSNALVRRDEADWRRVQGLPLRSRS